MSSETDEESIGARIRRMTNAGVDCGGMSPAKMLEGINLLTRAGEAWAHRLLDEFDEADASQKMRAMGALHLRKEVWPDGKLMTIAAARRAVYEEG